MKNRLFKYPLLLGTVALVAGLLLALVYNVTSPIIERNKNRRENAAIVEMFGDDVKIEDISSTLNIEEKEEGIKGAVKATDNGSVYYVYKITIADSFDGDESSFVVAIDNEGKIAKIKFSVTGDSYASGYATSSYETGIKGKTNLDDSDAISGATKTGKTIIEAINVSIAHQGRVE